MQSRSSVQAYLMYPCHATVCDIIEPTPENPNGPCPASEHRPPAKKCTTSSSGLEYSTNTTPHHTTPHHTTCAYTSTLQTKPTHTPHRILLPSNPLLSPAQPFRTTASLTCGTHARTHAARYNDQNSSSEITISPIRTAIALTSLSVLSAFAGR